MKKITAIFLCVLLFGTFLISGCQKTSKKPNANNNTQVQKTSDADKREMASRFSNLANQVNGVQKATVVVSSAESTTPGSDISGLTTPSGDLDPTTADKIVVMAGITLDSKIDKTKEQSIKDEVRKKIMESDNRVSEVLVTTNPDMIKKLQDVAAGVIQGKPFQSYAQDVEELNKNIRAQ